MRQPLAFRRGPSPQHATTLLLAALLCLPTAATASASFTKPFHQVAPAPSGRVVDLENLAGTVRLGRAPGAEVVVDATIHAEAGTDAAARALADRLRLAIGEKDGRLVITADYPLDDYDSYYYPRPGEGASFFGLDFGPRSEAKFHDRRVTVYGAPHAGAAGLWADFTIALPAGTGASIKNIAGPISADAVDGPLALDTGWGDITATGGAAGLTADTGSGDVTVRDRRGALRVDTGSGDVLLERIDGNASVDTGSGDARLTAVTGEIVRVDTGSGNVHLDKVRGELSADTGSGNVLGSGLTAVGRLYADTGSGDVRLDGDFSALTGMKVSTGSGDVILGLRSVSALHFSVSTGSGDITVDVPDLRIRRTRDDELEADIGSGNAGVADISTGSGDVQLLRRP